MHKLICPKCHEPLTQIDRSFQCSNHHNYDLSKSKYLNLLLNPDKATNNPGDSKESLVARKAYLNQGYYNPISDRLNELIQKYKPEAKQILDLGCGEGSITIPLSKEVKSVTAIDSSYKMLEILTEKIKENNIKNIKIIEEDINNITINKVGKHDIILASRSLNGISNIQETITNINEIANKYIFITIFGPNNQKIEKEFYELIDKEYNEFSSHRYFFNILMDMEIYPNVENLNIENPREYKDINEILENKKWDLDNLNNDEKEQLKKYIKEIFEINPETGNLFNKNDKMEWVLYWWKVK